MALSVTGIICRSSGIGVLLNLYLLIWRWVKRRKIIRILNLLSARNLQKSVKDLDL